MKQCNKEDCNNLRFGGGYCRYHQGYRTDKKLKELNSKPLSKPKRPKSSGELEVFKMIWSERSHKCQCCGVTLSSFSPINFSHILSKGAYPRFKLLKENIKLVCSNCHQEWEFSDRKDSKFDWVKEKYDKLRYKYYNE